MDESHNRLAPSHRHQDELEIFVDGVLPSRPSPAPLDHPAYVYAQLERHFHSRLGDLLKDWNDLLHSVPLLHRN